VRLRLFLALSLVVLAVVAATVVIYDRLEDFNAPSDLVVGPAEDGGAVDAGEADAGPPERAEDGADGVLRIEGTVTAVHLEGAVLDPRAVPTPLTLVSNRGFGNGGEVTGVTVEGRRSAIVWDGGRPFVLASGPGLVPDPSTVDLAEDGLHVSLGGGVHSLAPGTYRLDTPVAVGDRGVATPRDAVTFVAGDDAQLEADGDTALVLTAPEGQGFTGPGSVHLEGDLVIDQGDSVQQATSLDLQDQPFDLIFTSFEGGRWTVSGRLESHRIGDLILGSGRRPPLWWRR
jgi:hypothetical protein